MEPMGRSQGPRLFPRFPLSSSKMLDNEPLGSMAVVKIRVPFWGTLNIRCRIIIRTQKGTLILTTTHMVYT